MIIHIFNKEIIEKTLSENYKNGNFGLWFNKFIPLSDNNTNFHPCNQNGEENSAVEYYKKVYDNIKNNNYTRELLDNKHYNQICFYESFKKKYEIIIISAELISPLITGIGQTHPNEVGMTFDHTIGIPYIPASTVKGIVRFSHTIGLLDDLRENHLNEIKKDKKNENNNEIYEYFNDEAEWTNVSKIFGFGGDKGNIGRVIFLDAYPEAIPELYVDIMNPHYGYYYSGKEPPADYLNPNPIKFLTVAKVTKFIFRILINKTHNELKDNQKLKDLVLNAMKKSLEEEGIGAKTAVGYGLFKIECYDEPMSIKNLISKRKAEKAEKIKKLEEQKKIKEIENMSEIDKICYKIDSEYEENYAMDILKKIDNYNTEDKIKIAKALKEAWIKKCKWDKKDKLSSKQEKKVEKIKSILNE